MAPAKSANARAPLLRAYLAANTRFEQGQRLANAVFTGAWLGVMDRERLAALDASYYDSHLEVAGDRALRYTDPDHIRSGLSDWEKDAFKAHFAPGARIVITGAGAGREVHGAFGLGFEAVGFEPHPDFVAAGARLLASEGHPDALRLSERDAFPADAPAADAVVVGWGSYSHIPGSWRRVAFLRGARAILAPGAPILVSFWMLPGRGRYLRTVRGVASVGRRLTRGEPVEHGDLLSPFYSHCFTSEQVEAELRAAGFRLEALATAPYPHAIGRAR